MTSTRVLTQGTSDDDKYDEEWVVVLQSKGRYQLSKIQATILKEEIARGNRGTVMFQTFAIPIPYIVEFFRERRFLKDAKALPATASEPPYKPMPKEQWEKFRRECYQKIGKPMPIEKER